MESTTRNIKPYIAIGIFFAVVVVVVVVCVKRYPTVEKFLPLFPSDLIQQECSSFTEMFDNLKPVYKNIMRKDINFECDLNIVYQKLFLILQEPILKILNNASTFDKLDHKALVTLWVTVFNGMKNMFKWKYPDIIVNRQNGETESIIFHENESRDLQVSSWPISRDPYSICNMNNRPECERHLIEDKSSDYYKSLIDISHKAQTLLTSKDIDALKTDNSTVITVDKMTKLLLLLLIENGTFFIR